MTLLSIAVCLALHAAPAPTPSAARAPNLFELWTRTVPSDPGDWPTPAPPELAPRGAWRPYMIVRADGRAAWIDSSAWDRVGSPYAETQLGAADLAYLRELVATLGLPTRRFTCDARSRARSPLAAPDLPIRMRVVVPGRTFEWPYCAEGTLPPRLDHLARVASRLVRGVPAGPLYAIGVQDFPALTPAAPGFVIERDGHWRTAQRSGRLDATQLASLAARIRDTRLALDRHLIHCAAEPTSATTLDLGLAGSLTWVSPCSDGPHPDVHALIAFVATLVPADP